VTEGGRRLCALLKVFCWSGNFVEIDAKISQAPPAAPKNFENPIANDEILDLLHSATIPPELATTSTRTHAITVMTTDPIPFRFKAGGIMAAPAVHHHRNDTSKPNKAFKSKFASKGALKERAKGECP
jgi:hypothetical protein